MKYYKFLTADNRGEYSRFDFTDYLPKDGKSGKWLPKTSNPVICEQGYHCFKPEHILEWLNTQLFEVEIRGKTIEGDTKTAARQMRFVRKVDAWNDSSARVFACFCAYQVLPLFENKYPDDNRPRKAIETARLFAEGKKTKDQLAAAWAAARAAAWDAARPAAWAAAWAAARDAAWDAARAAARDAAGPAARPAAWAAARAAAWAAARDVAGPAARAAAWDAARAAAWTKYTDHLLEFLGISDED